MRALWIILFRSILVCISRDARSTTVREVRVESLIGQPAKQPNTHHRLTLLPKPVTKEFKLAVTPALSSAAASSLENENAPELSSQSHQVGKTRNEQADGQFICDSRQYAA